MSDAVNPFVVVWPYPSRVTMHGPAGASPKTLRMLGEGAPEGFAHKFADASLISVVDDGQADAVLTLAVGDRSIPAEGYRLVIEPGAVRLSASDLCGLAYGCHTLIQLGYALRGAMAWPAARVEDEPALAVRSAMVDLGRTVATLPMLKRLVRIFHRLRYNQLHLRLYDDELCGLKFDGLPFGRDNPFAISIDELKQLVDYARKHHIRVMPELESWGHVNAITHHRPDLRGGPGVYAGASFLVGEPVVELMTELVDQVAQVMEDDAMIHLGFDEAKWFTGASIPKDYAPADLLLRYDRVLDEVGRRHGKHLQMQVYADHAGRTVPDAIRDRVVVQPWQYWIANRGLIDKAIEIYGEPGAKPWAMSVGQSLAQYRGAYLATRYFCQRAKHCHGLRGATICLWGWNDWDRLLITYFAGAQFLWNPKPPTPAGHAEDQESCDRFIFPVMHQWQTLFNDATSEQLEQDRGPIVFRGFYHWGPDHGKPVSPSAESAGTFRGHDFVNEHHLLKDQPETDSP